MVVIGCLWTSTCCSWCQKVEFMVIDIVLCSVCELQCPCSSPCISDLYSSWYGEYNTIVAVNVYTSAVEASAADICILWTFGFWQTLSGKPITTGWVIWPIKAEYTLWKVAFWETRSLNKPFQTLIEKRWCCNVYY